MHLSWQWLPWIKTKPALDEIIMSMTVNNGRLDYNLGPFTRCMMTNEMHDNLEVATLAGGCFWCLEAVYDELNGVVDVVSGYSGGNTPNPSYEAVCTGQTGHAETVQLIFDPNVVTYQELLEVFFTIHDPTTLNRQGADVGTQYRSAIFYHTPEQKATAERVISELEHEKIWGKPIVTELTPFSTFYPAEAYHQEYFKRNPYQGYCMAIIAPKVAKFRSKYLEKLKKT
jgi:peptide-methionine (S)-S-oxide reductase